MATLKTSLSAGKVCPKMSTPAERVKCIEHECAQYQMLMDAEQRPVWDCAFNWTNILLIEQMKETRQFAAAVESERNVMGSGIAAVVAQVQQMTERALALPVRSVEAEEKRPPLLRRLGFGRS